MEISDEYDIQELKELIKSNDITSIKKYMSEHNLEIHNNRICPKNKKYFEDKVNFYDLKQYVQKIFSNSGYGSLLNNSSVFYDFRLGASITMTGRRVWKHLTAKTAEILTGDYNHKNECVITGDTDSNYSSIDNEGFRNKYPNFDYSRDNMVKFADEVGNKINASFPEYMIKDFHCTEENAKIEQAAREVVASSGLVCGKKRYALMLIDKDGHRQDVDGKPGKIKIQGIQTQRSDTPMIVRKLLKKMIESLLTTGNIDDLYKILKDFKHNDWLQLKPWQKGTPKAVNKLTYYTKEYERTGKCSVGHVMGAINWNNLIKMNNDRKSPQIKDGDKVIVCKLKDDNIYNMKSVAYPIDLNILPQWFKELPFDEQKMSGSVVDKTIESIFGVLDLDLSLDSIQDDDSEELSEFIITY